MTTPFSAGQVPTAAELRTATAEGVLRRGRRTSSTATTTTELAVLRVDGIPVTAGRIIKIWTPPLFAGSSVAGDNTFVRIRYSTAGVASLTSTILTTDIGYSGSVSSTSPKLAAKYLPPSDQTLSVLLVVGRWAGTGNCSIGVTANLPEIELIVEDTGADPGDTGISL